MKRLSLAVIFIFWTLLGFAEEISIAGYNLSIPIPEGFIKVAGNDHFIGFRKGALTDKNGYSTIAISFTSFQKLLADRSDELMPAIRDLLTKKHEILTPDIEALVTDDRTPLVFRLSPYRVYSRPERINAAGSVFGVFISSLSLDRPDNVSGPFLFKCDIIVKGGVVTLSAMPASGDPDRLDSELSHYGEIVNRSMKYTGQDQLDRIFSDMEAGKLNEVSEVKIVYDAFKKIVASLTFN